MAVEALDWVDPPSLTTGNDAAAYSMGCLFTVPNTIACPGVRWRVPDSISATPAGIHRASLWSNDGGGRLAFANFTPVPGGDQDILFSAPVTLNPGTNYVVCVYTMDYSFRVGAFPYSTPSVLATATTGKLVANDDPDELPLSNFNSAYYVSPLLGTVDVSDPPAGEFSLPLPPMGLALTGEVVNPGAFSLALPPMGLAFTGAVNPTGAFSLPLPPMGLALTGTVAPAGEFSLPLPPMGLVFTGTSEGTAPPSGSGQGGWAGLLTLRITVAAEWREQQNARPVACPNDGEPLEEVRGVLHCRYDGWTWRP